MIVTTTSNEGQYTLKQYSRSNEKQNIHIRTQGIS